MLISQILGCVDDVEVESLNRGLWCKLPHLNKHLIMEIGSGDEAGERSEQGDV